MISIILNEDSQVDDCLEIYGVEFIVYYYGHEDYSGYGMALLYKDNKWFVHDMGHCSCYGPYEYLDFKTPVDSLDEVIRLIRDEDWSGSYEEAKIKMLNEAEKFLRDK